MINILEILEKRFNSTQVSWNEIVQKLESNPKAIRALEYMEETEGAVNFWKISNDGKLLFTDFSKQTPNRRNFCYDNEALEKRKKFKPADSAVNICEKYGIRLLTEAEYRELQEITPMDITTSSWIHTPKKIRDLGGALFGDRRFDTVFIYHNGADSYYAARGFRAVLEVE